MTKIAQDPEATLALLKGETGPGRSLDRSTALGIARGVQRTLSDMGYASLVEFALANGRRADVFGLNDKGEMIIVEVKSSIADFRSDQKWPDYLDFCDAFFFAVGEDFPLELIPEDCGLLVADAFAAALHREAPRAKLSGARRRSLMIQFARLAALRLQASEEEEL